MLEMGEPVRIIDLARNMIRLAGYEPDAEIAIEIVGVRPGEKIHEELFNDGERCSRRRPSGSCGRARPLDPEWVEETIERLESPSRLRRRGGPRGAHGGVDGDRGRGRADAGLIHKITRHDG